MFVLVVGGGKVGSNVTRTLRRLNHEIVLIEQDARRYESLEVEFQDGALYGDGTELHVLEQAGIKRPPDIVVAVTGDDEDNIVICQLAKERYGVPKVVARVNDPPKPRALRPPRDRADRLGNLDGHGFDRARGSRARARPPARAPQGESRDRRGRDRPGLEGRRQAHRGVETPGGDAPHLGHAGGPGGDRSRRHRAPARATRCSPSSSRGGRTSSVRFF